jgi:hypothetical protein
LKEGSLICVKFGGLKVKETQEGRYYNDQVPFPGLKYGAPGDGGIGFMRFYSLIIR